MSLRLKCPSCQAAFLTSDDALGQSVPCPKCGTEQQVPRSVPAGDPDSPEPSVWFPRPEDEPPRQRSRLRRIGLATLLLLPVLAVGLLVAWPWLRDWSRDRPQAAGLGAEGKGAREPHPAEAAARGFLQALVAGDEEAIRRLGVVEDPPAIRAYEAVRLDESQTQSLRGSFAPIAELHARIDEDYVYDEEIGRFQPRNALGPAAESLDALHATKDMAEATNLFSRLADPDPHAALDAIDDLAKVVQPMVDLSETTLSPEKLIPSYIQLVEQADPPLSAVEESLALDFGGNRETWDALLNRPFSSLRADGPFLLDRAEVVARVRDRLAESDAPPSTLRLTLTRFRLEGIDTGWKVTGARRERPQAGPADATTPTPEVSPPSLAEPPSFAEPPASPGVRTPTETGDR